MIIVIRSDSSAETSHEIYPYCQLKYERSVVSGTGINTINCIETVLMSPFPIP